MQEEDIQAIKTEAVGRTKKASCGLRIDFLLVWMSFIFGSQKEASFVKKKETGGS